MTKLFEDKRKFQKLTMKYIWKMTKYYIYVMKDFKLCAKQNK